MPQTGSPNSMKIRKAFVMSVRADAEHEYEKRHDPVLSL